MENELTPIFRRRTGFGRSDLDVKMIADIFWELKTMMDRKDARK